MDIETLVAELATISENEMCRYMFLSNKTVDLTALTRCEVLTYNNDAYGVVKNVSYSKTPYYRLIYPFVSKTKDKESVRKSFEEAKANGIKDVVLDSNTLDFYKEVIPNFDESKLQISNTYTDFYSDFNTRFVEHNENKFLKQHKIKIFKDDIVLRRLTMDDYNDVKALFEAWSDSKQLHNNRSFNNFFKYYHEIIMNPNKFFYCITFKGTLITWGIINFHGTNNHIAYEEVQQSYNRNMLPPGMELTEENNKFLSNIGQIAYWFLYKYLTERGVDLVHCAGSASGLGSLLDYKFNLYKNKVDYYLYSLKED